MSTLRAINSRALLKSAVAAVVAVVFSLAVMPGFASAAELSIQTPTDIGSNGYHVTANPQAKVNSKGGAAMMADPLPSTYRTANLTSVKDQDRTGMCWAFCTIGAAEANAIVKGLANSSLDLSERHLAYYFYNNATDPLGGTEGDLNATMYDAPVDFLYERGGDSRMASRELASWKGFVSESDAPIAGAIARLRAWYDTYQYREDPLTPEHRATLDPILNEFAVSKDLAYAGDFRLRNCEVVSNDSSNMALMKRMIMERGAGVTSVSSGFRSDSNLWAFTSNAHRNMYAFDSAHADLDHAVLLVGWDDNYNKENFARAVKSGVYASAPSSNGAWICRNSWGADDGDNGYFYLSYEDVAFNNSKNTTVFFEVDAAGTYDNNYQYDGTLSSSSVPAPNNTTFANVFTVKANPGKPEVLKAVSVDVDESCIGYSIQVYKNPTTGDPSSGTPMLDEPLEGVFTFAGYHTVDLGQEIWLNQGDTFAVAVTMNEAAGSEGDGTVDVSLDASFTGSWYNSEVATVPNTSFIYWGNRWNDLSGGVIGGKECSARIKAFTVNEDEIKCDHRGFLGVIDAQDATCTEPGSIAYWVCTNCSAYLSSTNLATAKVLDAEATVDQGGIIVPALGHNMSAYKVTTPATCTKAGVETSSCSRCDNTATRSIKALGHTLGAYVVTTAPTCLNAGVETATCIRCDVYKNQAIAALGHDMGAYVETTAPTCAESAIETSKCSRCDESTTREGRSALGHDMGAYAVTTAATCTKAGVETSSCSRCDNTATRSIKALGHTLGDYVETTAATCTEAAIETATCIRCDVSKTREGRAALGHEYGEPYVVTAPQCVYDGVARRDCERCDNYQEQAIAATGHTLEPVQGQPVACETDGFLDHYECTECGFLSSDSKGNTPVSFADLTIKATGHSMGQWYEIDSPTCEGNGHNQRDCSKCSYFETQDTDPSGHVWADDYTVDQEPSFTKPGGKSIHCTACDAKTDFQEIPAFGQTPLSACELVVNQNEFAYTGSYFKPDFTLFFNGEEVDPSLYTISPTKGYYTVGPHTIKITAVSGDAPFMGTTSVDMLVKPKATYITKLTRGSRYFKAYWSKRSTQTSGYQLRYSLYEDMHTYSTKTITSYKTTYKKVSSLKKKRTYYVMVRTYKTVSGKKYYSEWSAIKKVTTK